MEKRAETTQEVAIREFLLRRIPRLLELEGEARLEQFQYVCGLAVQRAAKGLVPPGTCVTTLLQVATQGDVPAAAARGAIRRALGEAGQPALVAELKAALKGALAPARPPTARRRPRQARRRREGTLTADRQVWLRALFADGKSKATSLIEHLARQRGWLKPAEAISRNSPFQDARRALGIVTIRRGFGRIAAIASRRHSATWTAMLKRT
jgi:hypothetical protein